MQQQKEEPTEGGGADEAGASAAIVGQVGRTFRGLKGSHVGAEAGQWLVIHSHSLDGWARVSHPDGRYVPPPPYALSPHPPPPQERRLSLSSNFYIKFLFSYYFLKI
jgi:hypothetical protein